MQPATYIYVGIDVSDVSWVEEDTVYEVYGVYDIWGMGMCGMCPHVYHMSHMTEVMTIGGAEKLPTGSILVSMGIVLCN
jgi:hypothetical protein